MKYIDAERLREELQKPNTELKAGNYYLDNSEQAVGYENALIDFELLITSLQQEQPDIDEIKREWYNKGYLKGRKEAHIPARELGLPKSCDTPEQPEIDLDAYIEMRWNLFNKQLKQYGKEYEEVILLNWIGFYNIARGFYELGSNTREKK